MNWHVNPQENLSADFHYYNINIFYTWIYVPKKIHMYFLRITFLHKISQVFPVNNVSHKVPQKFPVIFFPQSQILQEICTFLVVTFYGRKFTLVVTFLVVTNFKY